MLLAAALRIGMSLNLTVPELRDLLTCRLRPVAIAAGTNQDASIAHVLLQSQDV